MNITKNISLILILVLCLLAVGPAAAQEDTDPGACQIDLTNAIQALEQAQQDAAGGDPFTALQQIKAAQAELEAIQLACAGRLFALPMKYIAADQSIAFQYPAGWAVKFHEPRNYVIGTSLEVINALDRDGFEALPAGDQVLMIYTLDINDETMETDSFQQAVSAFRSDLEHGPFALTVPVQTLEIDGHPAQRLIAQRDIAAGVFDFIDYESGATHWVVMVAAIGEIDQAARVEALLDAFELTLQLPARVTLRESTVALSDLSYPAAQPLADLSDYLKYAEPLLSPDGQTLVWQASRHGNEFCFFTLATQQEDCRSFSMPTAQMIAPRLHWSPDGRYIAFTADFYRRREEADLWLYTVDTNEATNLTDDGYDEWPPADGDKYPDDTDPVWIDSILTWGPDNMLYFLRGELARPADPISSVTTGLYRIDPQVGVPERVRDLSPYFSILAFRYFRSAAFDGEMTISPDGTQLALIVHERDAASGVNGVWVIDLADETQPARQITTDDLAWANLPSGEAEAWALSMGLGWDNTSTGLFVIADTMTPNETPRTVVYHVNVKTGVKTLLAAPQELILEPSHAVSGTVNYLEPAGVIAPNGDGVIIFNRSEAAAELLALALTPEGVTRVPLLTLEDFDPPITMSISAGRDGTLCIGGFLFVPAP